MLKIFKYIKLFFFPEEDLRLLVNAESRMYADMLKEALEKNGIKALVSDEGGNVYGLGSSSVMNVCVYVRKEDYDKSLEIKEIIL